MVKKVIRFIVLIIGLSLVAYSGYHLFKIFWDYRTSDKTYEKLQDAYTVDDSKKSDDNDSEAADQQFRGSGLWRKLGSGGCGRTAGSGHGLCHSCSCL